MGDTYILRGEKQRTKHAHAVAVMDLSGAAVAGNVILHPTQACTLLSARVLYTEASSADAGVAIKIGKETDDDYYFTGTSATSQSQWAETSLTLLKTDVAAGDTVICSSAGGKTGTGEVLVCIEYKVNP